ncbi:bifunctional anthranilate synthase component II/anthranilate phosphoribosyltransferase [Fumia xinanensis]|uniref:Anthranilate phosphoribosyltransferase n=1 Tax=Fumia xinanensis TaxID=2763659 RepID=A0A926I6P2_9FIRM|nr:bifunctional anthranilate synthase component II/anthranilate phosphoribosyltransferase [Fumia xinanensis]MBC8559066.1 bifunctional anthranilate synthase component II/anthranilate phosphoribosyltransferase [Fumia xinanensis]
MILLLDNYDSFTYNLYQAIGPLCPDIQVVRNDKITIDEMEKMGLQALIVSPGPGYPSSAGISEEAIRHFSGKIPILGICLGHQAIGEAFGGKVVPAIQLMHGKASSITLLKRDPILAGLPESIEVARYHSLIIQRESLPDTLEILAEDEVGQIMAVKHKEHLTYGLQFHPESILTGCGGRMLENFLNLVPNLSVTPLNTPQSEIPPAQRNALKPYIFKAIEGENLTREEAFDAMTCIMSGGATNAQIGSFLTALRMKGETTEEITGFAQVMRKKGKNVKHDFPVIDIVGTGGDLANTFNISTTSSFVIAGAGTAVAKHGNRSVSSKSGAADVLEALGFTLSLSPDEAAQCLRECGISFLFAPAFHGSMKFAAMPRKEIGVRSVFNILGPLANPAASDYILLGVYDEALMEPMAQVLMNLGVKGAMLVHGEDGLDEISISGPTKVCEIREGKLIKYAIRPSEFGVLEGKLDEIVGGTAEENARITVDILSGKERGPRRGIVLMNAGCALYTAGAASSIGEGIEMAKKSIDSGAALEKLNALKDKTNALAKE